MCVCVCVYVCMYLCMYVCVYVCKYVYIYIYIYIYKKHVKFDLYKKPKQHIKANQFHYRPEVPRGFQEFKVPRLRDNCPG